MACLTNFNIHKPINKDFFQIYFREGGQTNASANVIVQTFSQVLIFSKQNWCPLKKQSYNVLICY